ncbi:tetratricopeptide repeat protein [Streptomyces caniscabiei]|uniref:Tetratricopeptide repeat protein 38 n=1 Tax=Streptomyces caniscabiei TaxID=2746961 RepID=A0ABU4N1C8_9ACTN|nr:tetratricopeptide repeat protein [Streptomyces caniscabiei]MBE4734033.1 tetratricopeptide repeat protein [Streptomyces caniscabiei]MBE4762387.1 tetratricopeptide repeat protein [Streptomyces caniscabiei]MBE4769110.1 tetratricopeptide repeat protein [Streptomyces caniscabiei]MBE4782756.1 tetratricopeptide repeat protein [Streptomyces caniscabiei]MBE4792059.1 tetratricopeptide repeat protein [Streptomyces caniscabiei]
MVTDRYGNRLYECTAEGAAHLDRAVEGLLFFRPEFPTAVADAVAACPESPMAQAFAAYLGVLGTESRDAEEAGRGFLAFSAGLDRTALPLRERMHMAAAGAWLGGDLGRAGRILEDLVVECPRDPLALAVGHQLDFFTGDATRLRDRIGGALPAWDRDDPHRGPLLGMYAFGLEESGHYDRAQEVARAAVERNPRDIWAIHAVVHVHEMQGRFAEGLGFLDARLDDWASGSLLTVHSWWHYALYALEAGDTATALRIYDAVLHHEESSGFVMELLDAASLLWRFLLDGSEQEARWRALADAWAAREDPPFYAFNDAHAVMAFAGAGRLDTADEFVADRRRWLRAAREDERPQTNRVMTAEVGLPVCEALVAFVREDYATAVDLLWPIRRRLHTFGGSHAQRDAVQRTLLEAALRARRDGQARLLLGERAGLSPHSPYNWLGRARLADALGEAGRAAVARATATELAAPAAARLSGNAHDTYLGRQA